MFILELNIKVQITCNRRVKISKENPEKLQNPRWSEVLGIFCIICVRRVVFTLSAIEPEWQKTKSALNGLSFEVNIINPFDKRMIKIIPNTSDPIVGHLSRFSLAFFVLLKLLISTHVFVETLSIWKRKLNNISLYISFSRSFLCHVPPKYF